MMWTPLTEENQLEEILEQSTQQPVVIFKHSTRCSISAMAKSRLERATAPDKVHFYYLDLLTFRPVSNRIAELFSVHHESPQILVIRNKACVYDASHSGISMPDIVDNLG